MIAAATNMILEELRASLQPAGGGPQPIDSPEFVLLGNIALADGQDLNSPINDRMVLSIVNIAEEAALKNEPVYQRTENGVRVRNAPKYLNLFLLFSANYGNYEFALRRLSQVIRFFQGKNVFTLQDSPAASSGAAPEELRIALELMALTFEQVNYVWASLGGKQMPSVMYKARLVRIHANRQQSQVPAIEEVTGAETAV